MTDRLTLPILPLRDVVLFPGVTAPIGAGRPMTLKAIEAALATPEKLVFAVSQRENVEQVASEGLHRVGTIARIGQLQRGMSGMQLLLHGEQRGMALQVTEEHGYLVATVRPMDDLPAVDLHDPSFEALHKELRARAAELGQKSGLPEDVVQQVLEGVDDAGRFADLVAGYLDLSAAQRQELLETLAVDERLRRVLVHVQRQIAVLDAQEDIKSQVQEELGERQREVYLREQLKTIRRELGEEDDGTETDELAERLAALELPPEARKEVDRELGRLRRIGRESMESQVIRTFLEHVAELPWNVRDEEHIDIPAAQEILDADHYALGDVKDRVLEFLAVRALRASQDAAADGEDAATDDTPADTDESRRRSPILLFVGPPGVGKTSVAKSIARAMGRKYVRVSLGGARDEADIRGHRRTYVGAMPGRIIQGLKQAGSSNPVFLLDEVDKLGVSFQGDPASALLEVLDPAQNDSFTDHYLGIPFDLSQVMFIATANVLQQIPAPLLDRMEIVEFSGYIEAEKVAIAERYLVPRQVTENGLTAEQLHFTGPGLLELVQRYTREAGVRQLEREIGRVARKAARRFAAGEQDHLEVTPAVVRELLGRPKLHPEEKGSVDQVGTATGMYYTPQGGDIMFVEASTMRGKGELVLTGQLGDVMKESARAAWTYARAHAAALHIADDRFDLDVHIHVPAGAVPKDGPSAGITMATALISTLSGREVRHDIAMTGEVTLRGRVLPIGGVKEKLLGALRAGIRRVIIPRLNEPDLEDLPEAARKQLEVFPVEELGEVLALALKDVRYSEGKLLFGDENPRDVVPLSSGYRH
ncbi:MAG: endopeptidase La [Gemmatimonadetes bacterium]|nr:endopeptidase La [Gemmatimonadota bacterium]MCB9505329.1 endopeptidase La [Gemmatimonadales bacterium]MCA9762265.1 endopeptidase La [Gemmatimonadota bacterium]MCA9767491.1 endopeptidase La [Gemmatimonadota bacterium]MCB9518037.1 endopeptidase La [Gemmatimonadales bacterium]